MSDRRTIDVAEVDRVDLMRFAGKPWREVVAHGDARDGVTMRQVPYGSLHSVISGEKALLREIDGRAFIYLQNW